MQTSSKDANNRLKERAWVIRDELQGTSLRNVIPTVGHDLSCGHRIELQEQSHTYIEYGGNATSIAVWRFT